MKKLLLATLTACGVWLGAQAQNTTHDYTDDLVVSVDNFSTPPMPTTVSIEFPEEGLINIELKNFTLEMEGADPIPVGNIHVSDDEKGQNKIWYSPSLKNKILNK